MIMLMMRAVNCLSKVATSKAIILILLFGKYHVIIQQQQQQQQILLKIGKITNYITFPPANSLWTNQGGGSWRHITKQDLYIDGLNNSEDTTIQ